MAELPPGPQGKPPSAPSSGSPLLFREVANLGNVRRPGGAGAGCGELEPDGKFLSLGLVESADSPGPGVAGNVFARCRAAAS